MILVIGIRQGLRLVHKEPHDRRRKQVCHVDPSPALMVVRATGERSVGTVGSPDHVRGVGHHDCLGQCGRRRRPPGVSPRVDKGSDPRCRGTRVAGARAAGIVSLCGGPVLVADAVSVKAGGSGSGPLDMGARRNEFRLPPAVVTRPPAREIGKITDVVGLGIRDAASVGAVHPVVLAGTHGDHVLGRPRRTHRIGTVAVVSGREEDDHFLQAI